MSPQVLVEGACVQPGEQAVWADAAVNATSTRAAAMADGVGAIDSVAPTRLSGLVAIAMDHHPGGCRLVSVITTVERGYG